MAHSIVHVEFATKNPRATGEFLQQLFGWSIHTSPMPSMAEGEYVLFESPGGLWGGRSHRNG